MNLTIQQLVRSQQVRNMLPLRPSPLSGVTSAGLGASVVGSVGADSYAPGTNQALQAAAFSRQQAQQAQAKYTAAQVAAAGSSIFGGAASSARTSANASKSTSFSIPSITSAVRSAPMSTKDGSTYYPAGQVINRAAGVTSGGGKSYALNTDGSVGRQLTQKEASARVAAAARGETVSRDDSGDGTSIFDGVGDSVIGFIDKIAGPAADLARASLGVPAGGPPASWAGQPPVSTGPGGFSWGQIAVGGAAVALGTYAILKLSKL